MYRKKIGFQTKHILNPRSMLFHPAKVPLKVFSIVFEVHSAHCDAAAIPGYLQGHFHTFILNVTTSLVVFILKAVSSFSILSWR